MAYITCKISSTVLMRGVEINLYLPTDLPAVVGNEIKGVLTLLHGYTNTCSDWMQMTAASRYAADNGLALIMPSCDNSFYHNMAYGGAWETFVTEEMPQILGRMFQLPTDREKNFIAGLSMGGYGALYLGLKHPDLYAGCASFSGAVDLGLMLREGDATALRFTFAPVFGDALTLPQTSDLHYLASSVSKLPADQQPKILMTNGLQDTPIYEIKWQNDALHETMRKLPFNSYTRMEWDGVHEWNFWDRSLVYAIDLFFNPGYAQKKHTDWSAPVTVYAGDEHSGDNQ